MKKKKHLIKPFAIESNIYPHVSKAIFFGSQAHISYKRNDTSVIIKNYQRELNLWRTEQKRHRGHEKCSTCNEDATI